MEANLTEIILSILGFIFTVFGTCLIGQFRGIKIDLAKMSSSVVEMNLKLERVITDQTWHRQEIKEINEKIKNLERRN